MPVKGSYVDFTPTSAPTGSEGRVYYDSTAKKLKFHDGTGWKDFGASAKILYAADESELSTTSTSYTSLKEFNLIKLSGAGINYSKMTVIVEAYNNTSGQTTTVGVFIDGSLVTEIPFTETSYTLKYAIINISGLSDNARHYVQIQVKVTGGTGYLRHLEVYVE